MDICDRITRVSVTDVLGCRLHVPPTGSRVGPPGCSARTHSRGVPAEMANLDKLKVWVGNFPDEYASKAGKAAAYAWFRENVQVFPTMIWTREAAQVSNTGQDRDVMHATSPM